MERVLRYLLRRRCNCSRSYRIPRRGSAAPIIITRIMGTPTLLECEVLSTSRYSVQGPGRLCSGDIGIIGYILGEYCGNTGIMENQMETTILITGVFDLDTPPKCLKAGLKVSSPEPRILFLKFVSPIPNWLEPQILHQKA